MVTPVEDPDISPKTVAPAVADHDISHDVQHLRMTCRTMSDAEKSHQQLFLSVLLLLIAFFAVLVSRSEIEQIRVDMVLTSLEGTFNPSFRIPQIIESTSSDPGSVAPSTEAETTTDLRQSIALTLDTETVDAFAFRFFLDPEALFEEPRPILRTDRLLMLGRLAASLADRATGSATRLTLLLEGPFDRLRGNDRYNVTERLDILRQRLFELGAPTPSVELGLRDGGQYRWVFEVDTREAGA